MAGLGNALSFELGGGPSPQEQVYDAMFQNVGTGIQADPETVVEKWRFSRARGIVAAQLDDKATAQAFPDISTDFLPVWEDILGIIPDPSATEADRQTTVLAAYTRVIDASFPAIESTLQDLDALMSILLIPHDLSRTTVPPRAFEDWDPLSSLASGPPFNLGSVGGAGANATAFPNYSDEFVMFVLYDIGVGAPTTTQQKVLSEAVDLLNETLPAWIDFQIFTVCGFILDQDLLDITALCDGVVIT